MLYIGLDNPISAAAAGFTPAQTHVTIYRRRSLEPDPSQKGAGHYILKPDGSQREITVKVSVTMSDGTTKQMGQQVYRVRPMYRTLKYCSVPKVEAPSAVVKLQQYL